MRKRVASRILRRADGSQGGVSHRMDPISQEFRPSGGLPLGFEASDEKLTKSSEVPVVFRWERGKHTYTVEVFRWPYDNLNPSMEDGLRVGKDAFSNLLYASPWCHHAAPSRPGFTQRTPSGMRRPLTVGSGGSLLQVPACAPDRACACVGGPTRKKVHPRLAGKVVDTGVPSTAPRVRVPRPLEIGEIRS